MYASFSAIYPHHPFPNDLSIRDFNHWKKVLRRGKRVQLSLSSSGFIEKIDGISVRNIADTRGATSATIILKFPDGDEEGINMLVSDLVRENLSSLLSDAADIDPKAAELLIYLNGGHGG